MYRSIQTFVSRKEAQEANAEKTGAVKTHTVSTDRGMLMAFANLQKKHFTEETLKTTTLKTNLSNDWVSNEDDKKIISKKFDLGRGKAHELHALPYHHIVPAVIVRPGNTVPPITRPRGYLPVLKNHYSAIQILTSTAATTQVDRDAKTRPTTRRRLQRWMWFSPCSIIKPVPKFIYPCLRQILQCNIRRHILQFVELSTITLSKSWHRHDKEESSRQIVMDALYLVANWK